MKFRLFFVLGLMLAMGVSGLPVAGAAEGDAFSSKQVRKSSGKSRGGKTTKNKKEKQKNEIEEEEDEGGSSAAVWGVADRESWEKIKGVKLADVRFSDADVGNFIAYMNKQMEDNQLTVKFQYQEDKISNQRPSKFYLNLWYDATVEEVLLRACQQMDCAYTVENGVVCLFGSKQSITRTYSVTENELYGLRERKNNLRAILKKMGVAVPETADISFNDAGDTLTVCAPSETHCGVFEVCREFEKMRANLPKGEAICKKYCATVRKVGKAACGVKPGKNAKAKLKKLRTQLHKACPEADEELLKYYLSVNPKEHGKLKKIEADLGTPMQNMIDSLVEAGDEAEEEAAFLHSDIMRFISEFEFEDAF